MNRIVSTLAVVVVVAVVAVGASTARAAPDYALALSCKKDANEAVVNTLDLMDNGHGFSELQAAIAKGVAADGNCAVVNYVAAMVNPSQDMTAKEDAAIAAAAKAPELDRTLLAVFAAQQKGDVAEIRKQAQKLATLAPKSFLPYMELAIAERISGNNDGVLAASKKATELQPKAGAAWNQLAYAYSALHKDDDAQAALKKYVEVAPTEANAHDTLADTLMNAGKLDEADAEYKKAVEVSGGKFAISYNGSAGVHFAKGDWDGGRALLAKWRDNEPDPASKVDAELATGWSYVAEGKAKEAIAAYDTADKNAAAAKALYGAAESTVQRVEALYELGKLDDAQKALDAAAKADTSKLPPGVQRDLRMRRAAAAVGLLAKAGKGADADKALAAVDAEAKGDPADVGLQDRAHVAHGEAALAKKDAKAAVAALSPCQKESTYCQWRLAVAQDAAGDAKAAQATRDAINAHASRTVMYAYARAKAAAKK